MTNIVILDNDTAGIELLTDILISLEYNPVSISNPDQLIKTLEDEKPDLLLMDIHLPGKDGLTLLKQLKATPAFMDIPVIMLTGDTNEKLMTRCFLEGAADFINKPFSKVVLQSRLRSALKIQRFIDSLKLRKLNAEEATKLKDKFVSLVSHDLRGPIGSIISVLELVRGGNIEGDEKNKIVDLAITSGNEMMSLIEDLLSVGKLRTGNLKPDKEFIDAYICTMKVTVEYGPIANGKGIELTNSVPKLSRIHANANLFYEVMRNLVSNAIKFSNRGDKVTLFIPDGEKTVIAVSDTGVGIKSKRLHSLFKYEEKTSTKGTSGEVGTGLGLPLCYDIMEAHGGSLKVESIEGKGSTFIARLPDEKPVILVVEDEVIDRRLIVGNIRKVVDVEIIEAENGKEATECIKKTPPDLVLTDINMPEMSGFELLKFLKEEPKTEKIPVIVITSSSEITERELAFTLGASDFVKKPLILEDFIPRIKRFVS